MAYYLMQDNRRRMPSSAYLRAELSEASDAAHSYPSGTHPRHGPASGAGFFNYNPYKPLKPELRVPGAVRVWKRTPRAVQREAAR